MEGKLTVTRNSFGSGLMLHLASPFSRLLKRSDSQLEALVELLIEQSETALTASENLETVLSLSKELEDIEEARD